MTNIIWKWNETDVSQFLTGTLITLYYGNANAFPGNLNVERVEFQGEPALRLYGQGNFFNKGAMIKIDTPSLPERYVIQFEILSSSVNSLTDSNFAFNFAPFANFTTGDGAIAANADLQLIRNWTGSITVNGGGTGYSANGQIWKSNAFWQCFVNMRPSSSRPSGSYHAAIVKYGFNADFDGATVSATQFTWRGTSAGILSSSWQGVDCDECGIGVGSYGGGGAFTGSIWIRDIRIMKHPLDSEFDNY